MKVKTENLSGAALDWAVGKCEVGKEAIVEIDDPHFYSTDWAQGGPIIEREQITLWINVGEWVASAGFKHFRGPTPLIAAMRCYVDGKLGDFADEVEVPDEFKEVTRLEKIKALTDNDLRFIAAEWDKECNPNDAINFYAHGGFATYSDEAIDRRYERLMAEQQPRSKHD